MEKTEKEKIEWFHKQIERRITELRNKLEYIDDLPDNVGSEQLCDISEMLDICLGYWEC